MIEAYDGVPDSKLLAHYADEGNDRAFAAFVERRYNLAYSIALRILNNDTHLAQDAVQQVFTYAAQHAEKIAKYDSIVAWIFTSTRFTAAKMVRGLKRRRKREQISIAMNENNQSGQGETQWDKLSQIIDQAISELSYRDRSAILLRFFENLDYKTIGNELEVSANAARMRVNRALDQLQVILSRKGIISTAAALGGSLSSYAVTAAPTGLASLATAKAVAAGATASTSFASLWGAIKLPAILAAIVAIGGSIMIERNSKLIEELSMEIDTLRKTPVAPAAFEERRSDRDAIDRAYAALDNDVEVLAGLLEKVDESFKAARSYPQISGSIYTIDELLKPPIPIKQDSPTYPEPQPGLGNEGNALIEFIVNNEGVPTDFKTISASHPNFAEAALEAALQWRFDPGKKGNETVNTRVRINLVFTRQEAKPIFENWFRRVVEQL